VNESDVLIVGAGPTGLVLALWLAKQRVRVRLID
jgi:2-polyprenyl-6-methoxyphenol hydroxylase-like FAD-dependent oxidoreductase